MMCPKGINPPSREVLDPANRPLENAERRQKLLHSLLRFGNGRIGKWVRRKVWRCRFRHMRYFPAAIAFQPAPDGTWIMTRRCDGRSITSVSLETLRHDPPENITLVATGPSANCFDWAGLSEKKTEIWAVNGAPGILAERGFRSDYLVVTDHRFARDGLPHIRLAASQGATLLFSHEAAAGVFNADPALLEQHPFHIVEKVNAWFALPAFPESRLHSLTASLGNPFVLPEKPAAGVGWSRDPRIGIFAGRTVTFAALQLAVWRGAKNIEIIGLDLGGKTRCYKEDVPAVSNLEKDLKQYILPSFACMTRALADEPVSILNHSEVSPLPRQLSPATESPRTRGNEGQKATASL